MDVPSFSVVVIARNEARALPALIESLGDFLAAGGELIVVDTGSDDDTVRVAREAPARVETVGSRFHSVLTAEQAANITAKFSRNGEGPLVQAGEVLFDFGRARQFAGQLASNDFVWHIDASDVVLSADLDFLDAEVRGGRVNGFFYLLRVGVSSFNVIRFFDRRLYAWRGRVHEAPFGTGVPMTGRRVVCDEAQLSLRHIGGEKMRSYFAGLALDAMEYPLELRWKHYLGRQLCYMGCYRSAIAALREHVRAKHGWAAERGESLMLIGTCLDKLGRTEAAAESYFRAARVDPSRREPLLKLAWLSQRQGDFLGSVAFASAALMVPRTSPFVHADTNYSWDPHAILYWGLFWLGRIDEAKVHWETCRRMAPENEKFLEDGRLFAT